MFRYSANKYSKALLKMGSIRIGTLHDFRKSEHKRGIADPQEGKKEVSHHIDHTVLNGGNSIHNRAAKEFRAISVGSGSSAVLENVVFSRRFNEPNCFVMCASKTNSKNVMKEFEGADSCIEIVNQSLFFELLTKSLNSIIPVIFRGVYKVTYQNRKETWNEIDWGSHPALIKEPEFSVQDEVRAIWQPRRTAPIEPINLCAYKLGTLCREVII